MTALKNIYARLIEKAGTNQTKLDALKLKIGSACAVGLLTDDEQLELITSMPEPTSTPAAATPATSTPTATTTPAQ